jgi:G3E family GTPase
MNNKLIIGLGLGVITLIIGAVLIGSVISTSNQEVELRTLIEAKQRDNKNQFDNTWKTISQAAQVTDAQKKALMEIIVGNSQSRNQKGGSLATFVREAVPNVDTSVFNNLMNIVTSKRAEFTTRQKELLDLGREHTTLLRRFPSGFILGFLGRKEISLTVVTSEKTEKAFDSGKDDDVKLFN